MDRKLRVKYKKLYLLDPVASSPDALDMFDDK